MNLIKAQKSSLTTKFSLVGIATLLFLSVVISSAAPASAAVTISTKRDCDSNAVIYCGALSTGELINKYNANPSARSIFSWFGITKQDVQDTDTRAVVGDVTKSGNVLVNGKVVARGAITAGRHNIAGSTKVVHQGVIFYSRPPSVSFRSNSLKAYVVLNKDGQFMFAVLATCGNPVKATNVVPTPPVVPPVVTPPVVVPPVTPPVVPPVVTPPVVVPPVVTPPVVVPVAPPAPVILPKTGPASLVSYFMGTSLIGAAAHGLYSRRRKV